MLLGVFWARRAGDAAGAAGRGGRAVRGVAVDVSAGMSVGVAVGVAVAVVRLWRRWLAVSSGPSWPGCVVVTESAVVT